MAWSQDRLLGDAVQAADGINGGTMLAGDGIERLTALHLVVVSRLLTSVARRLCLLLSSGLGLLLTLSVLTLSAGCCF